MAINKTEKLAQAWLSETYNIPTDSITFSPTKTPDFVLPDGHGFEIKRLYGDKIIVYPSQIKALTTDTPCTILVFRSGSREPVAKIPAEELLSAINDGTRAWRNIKIVVPGYGQMLIQVKISGDLLKDLSAYITAEYGPNERVLSVVVRRALAEYLEKKGYHEASQIGVS